MRKLSPAPKPSHLQAVIGAERAELGQDQNCDVRVASYSFLGLAPVGRYRRSRAFERGRVERNRKSGQQ